MDYTAFFQTVLDEHFQARERHRNQVQEQHARIVGLLSPLLAGIDATLAGQQYRDSTAEGPLSPHHPPPRRKMTGQWGAPRWPRCSFTRKTE